ncbi:hypothetical protein M409DRAFT_29217 [Zasmidium cellare ATCC 36951]|uniref:NmrA-like domain-containing protein n=1 Tax=Zasmidium cellare ATCC 36951 TaxID=1080233 RepID=A0A6A6C273_ZASCE|nr:uncharacterized protein M409DRAFT_29217 [Zasmidium cellare ATCC 36951]KAF2160368.1 hypothetical protein M409DRAFT_29217 [Zasmidium cellare ATCC 36951]
MASNHIRKVAIVGAGGNIGSRIVDALLATGKHTVTAITRKDTTSKFPEKVMPVYVDYNEPETIFNALRGQGALIITVGFFAPKNLSTLLVQAAAEAEVPWILPSEWSPDSAHEGLVRDISSLQNMPIVREEIKMLGKSSYVALCCGLWYEWCLSTPVLFGIDCLGRKATLFDDGNTKINTSTLAQVGRSVAGLLSLPIKSEDGACLDRFRNRHVYTSSFCISQNDMLESAFRVTGTDRTQWTIENRPVEEYYNEGVAARRQGTMREIGRQVYSRVFFDDDSGNFEKRVGLANEILNLSGEDLDEATATAISLQRQTDL